MTAERDPYAVLGVARDAEASAIAAAYRALARRHHPDVTPAAGAERRMAEINAAWAILRDPRRRWAWDRSNGVTSNGVGRAGSSTGGAAPAPTGRSSDHHRPGRGSGHDGHDGQDGHIAWRRGPNGEGAAGPPPGSPRGSVLPFGRHIGWSVGEIARVDPGYLQWLADRPEGAPYRAEIEPILAALLPRDREAGRSPAPGSPGRRRLPFG